LPEAKLLPAEQLYPEVIPVHISLLLLKEKGGALSTLAAIFKFLVNYVWYTLEISYKQYSMQTFYLFFIHII